MYSKQFDKEAVAIFKALSDRTRYQIVRMLLNAEEISCTEITESFTLSSPALSHHFRILENCGIMESRKEGLRYYFRLNRAQFERFLPAFQATHAVARQEATV